MSIGSYNPAIFYGSLSPAEHERLAWLLEECGEVQQTIGKILRHGYNSHNPDDPNHQGNRSDLERELNDVLNAISLLRKHEDILIDVSYRGDVGIKYCHCEENLK